MSIMNGSWRMFALCAQTDPEAFFVGKGETAADAREVCAACPVAAECLEDALSYTEQWGFWGGMSVKQRYYLKRVRRRAAA